MQTSGLDRFKGRVAGFSLIEVVLALGIFLVTILALVGLLGPTLKSVNEVETTDEVVSVVNTLNAFLQNSPLIAPTGTSKFDAIYNAVQSGNTATVFVFKEYFNQDSIEARVRVGFENGTTGVDTSRGATVSDFSNAAGTIYRVVLSASPVTPDTYRSGSRDGNGIYTLNTSLDNYNEGYFAMEVRIFAREQDMLAVQANGNMATTSGILGELAYEEPVFSYNTAIVR